MTTSTCSWLNSLYTEYNSYSKSACYRRMSMVAKLRAHIECDEYPLCFATGMPFMKPATTKIYFLTCRNPTTNEGDMVDSSRLSVICPGCTAHKAQCRRHLVGWFIKTKSLYLKFEGYLARSGRYISFQRIQRNA